MQDNVDEMVRQLHAKAKSLLDSKATEEEIVVALTKEGITPDYAMLIVDNVQNDIDKRKAFWRHLILGWSIMIATVVVNYYSYEQATSGSMYLIIWGTFVVGATLVIRAFVFYRK